MNPQVMQHAGAALASGDLGPCSPACQRIAASSRPTAESTRLGLAVPSSRRRERGRSSGSPDAPAAVLDAGCGDGYYLRRLRRHLAGTGQVDSVMLCGLDISKHGIRVAARRDPDGLYAVAGTFRMPVLSGRIDVLLTHFSPVSAADFRRVVRPCGTVLVGGPGEDHLYRFKELLYNTPERFEPSGSLTEADGFEPVTTHRIRYKLQLRGAGQVANLLAMTPFYWSADAATQTRLAAVEELDTEVDVLIHAYRRIPDQAE